MTAHAMSGDRDRCLDAGMDEYLTKPVNSRELYATIEKYLSNVQLDHKTSRPAAVDSPLPDPRFTSNFLPDGSNLVDNMARLFLQLAPERIERLQNAVNLNEASVVANKAKQVESAATMSRRLLAQLNNPPP